MVLWNLSSGIFFLFLELVFQDWAAIYPNKLNLQSSFTTHICTYRRCKYVPEIQYLLCSPKWLVTIGFQFIEKDGICHSLVATVSAQLSVFVTDLTDSNYFCSFIICFRHHLRLITTLTDHYDKSILRLPYKPNFHQMNSIENETVRTVFNDIDFNITEMFSLTEDLNTTIHKSFLFNFIDDYKNNYHEDFTSRLTFDLMRKLGHFER